MSEITNIAAQLAKKQEVVKDLIEQRDDVQELKAKIKELQEELKAVIASDTEIVGLQEEVKEIEKELKLAAKFIAKGTSFKPSVVVAFAKTSVKGGDAVDKVKDKGNAFTFLESKVGE